MLEVEGHDVDINTPNGKKDFREVVFHEIYNSTTEAKKLYAIQQKVVQKTANAIGILSNSIVSLSERIDKK